MIYVRFDIHRSLLLTASGLLFTTSTVLAFGSGGLKAEANGASASDKGRELAISIAIENTSNKSVQAFISEEPVATDNAGNSYSASVSTHKIGGIYICNADRDCLKLHKEETQNNATLIGPSEKITITLSLCCKNYDSESGTIASVGFTFHARDVIEEGSEYGPWRTISLGVPNIPVRGVRKN